MARLKPSQAALNLGLHYEKKAPKFLRDVYSDLPEVQRSSTLSHVMTGMLAGRPLTVFQTMYMIPAGAVTVPVSYVVYSTTAPEWPLTVVTRRRFFDRWLDRLRRRDDVVLDDPEFAKAMRVYAEDEDTSILILSLEMQRFLLEKPSITWRLGRSPKAGLPSGGRVDMLYSGVLKPDRIGASIERMARFWAFVPEVMAVD